MKKELPKFEHVLFLDRTHGKRMATLLRRVGIQVKSIYQCYPRKKHENIADPTWIAMCAKKGWVAVSGDKRLEKNIENRAAVIKHKVKIFILTDTNSLPEEWASAVIVGREKMKSVIAKNDGPFFATIQKQSRGHVSHARFPVLEPPKEKDVTSEEQEPRKDQNTVGLPADAIGGPRDSAGAKEEGTKETA